MDLLESFKVVSPRILGMHFVISILIGIVTIKLITQSNSSCGARTRSRKQTARNLIWNFLIAPFGQHNFHFHSLIANYVLSQYLQLTFLLSIFFVNLMSTDLISQVSPRLIDSLSDLLNSDLNAIFVKGSNLKNVFEQSSPHSTIGKIWSRTPANSSYNSDAFWLITDVMESGKVGIFETFVNTFVERAYCSNSSHDQNLFYRSKDVITKTSQGVLVSKNMNRKLLKFVTRRQNSELEFGLRPYWERLWSSRAIEITIDIEKCIINNPLTKKEKHPIKSLKIQNIKFFVWFVFDKSIFWFLVLIIERQLANYCKRKLNRKLMIRRRQCSPYARDENWKMIRMLTIEEE